MDQHKTTLRLQPFTGNAAIQSKSTSCDFLMTPEEIKKHLSEYSKTVQEAVKKPKPQT